MRNTVIFDILKKNQIAKFKLLLFDKTTGLEHIFSLARQRYAGRIFVNRTYETGTVHAAAGGTAPLVRYAEVGLNLSRHELFK